MRQNIVDDIEQLFKNKILNILGVERTLYQRIYDGDIDKVISLMQDRDEEVDNAIMEYNPQHHKVMHRPNKKRDNDDWYITCKLPRNLQSYINEVELFFLLGQPIVWKKDSGEDEAFGLFKDFLKESRFDAMMRKAKRLAGSETEAAFVYHLYQEKNEKGESEVRYIPFIVARSLGYTLRPLFDQYGQMSAFAYGYSTRENEKTSVKHWDILTKDYVFYCTKTAAGWNVESYENRIGKIPAVYVQQNKAWFGVEPRIDRIEELDSKTGDTNNYFSDPMAAATADVIENLADPEKPGRLIQLTGTNSKFEYITPPNASGSRQSEQEDLKDSVLFDTFTPNFDIDKMKGYGTLSGTAIKNTFILGYLKRDNRKEDYENYVSRIMGVIKSILKAMHPEKEKMIDELKISFEFSDPFASDKQSQWSSIISLYTGGVASLETVVKMLGLTDAPQDEINRIIAAEMDKTWMANEAKGVKPEDEEPQE